MKISVPDYQKHDAEDHTYHISVQPWATTGENLHPKLLKTEDKGFVSVDRAGTIPVKMPKNTSPVFEALAP